MRARCELAANSWRSLAPACASCLACSTFVVRTDCCAHGTFLRRVCAVFAIANGEPPLQVAIGFFPQCRVAALRFLAGCSLRACSCLLRCLLRFCSGLRPRNALPIVQNPCSWSALCRLIAWVVVVVRGRRDRRELLPCCVHSCTAAVAQNGAVIAANGLAAARICAHSGAFPCLSPFVCIVAWLRIAPQEWARLAARLVRASTSALAFACSPFVPLPVTCMPKAPQSGHAC
jgi:hypothetical protein